MSPAAKEAFWFLMMKEVGAEGSPRKINIVLNWLEELKQRMPVK